MKTIFFALFAGLSSLAQAQFDNYFEYQTSGFLDSRSEYIERFEMDFDRQVLWFSNSTGGLIDPSCSSSTAEYQGQLTEKQAEQLIKQAQSAKLSMPIKKDYGPPVRGIVKQLRVVTDKESWAINLLSSQEKNKEWKKMEDMLDEFKQYFSPNKMLNLSTHLLKNNKIQARFQYWGEKPTVIILPSDPNLVFFANGYHFKYDNSPTQELQQIGPNKKVIDIILNYKKVADQASLNKIFYSNRPAKHHLNTDFTKGHLRPQSANLCSVVLNH